MARKKKFSQKQAQKNRKPKQQENKFISEFEEETVEEIEPI